MLHQITLIFHVLFFISDKKRSWSPDLLYDTQDYQSILLPERKAKKKIKKEDVDMRRLYERHQ